MVSNFRPMLVAFLLASIGAGLTSVSVHAQYGAAKPWLAQGFNQQKLVVTLRDAIATNRAGEVTVFKLLDGRYPVTVTFNTEGQYRKALLDSDLPLDLSKIGGAIARGDSDIVAPLTNSIKEELERNSATLCNDEKVRAVVNTDVGNVWLSFGSPTDGSGTPPSLPLSEACKKEAKDGCNAGDACSYKNQKGAEFQGSCKGKILFDVFVSCDCSVPVGELPPIDPAGGGTMPSGSK